MEFYEKLRNIRKENNMSQEDLAGQLGVSRQAVSKWESGQGFPETDKLLQISSIFGVSLDYLLKAEQGEPAEKEEPGYYASREMVEGFLLCKRQGARRIGVGVGIMILAMIFVFIPGGGKGNILFLLGAVLGVAVLIAQGFRPKRYAELEKQPLLFDSAFIKEFRDTHAQNRRRYGMLIILGVVLAVLSCAAILLLEELPEAAQERSMGLLPLFWAAAVFLFINAGSALSAEGIIANNAAHMKERAKEDRHSWLFGAIMPVTAMVYLAIGFIWGAWHPGWIIFPAAALLCGGLVGWLDSR